MTGYSETLETSKSPLLHFFGVKQLNSNCHFVSLFCLWIQREIFNKILKFRRNMIFKKIIILAVKSFQCCFDFEEDKPLNLSYMPFVLSLLWSPIKGDHKTYLLSYLFFDHYCAVIDKISYHRSWRFFPFRIKTSIEFYFFPPNNHIIVRII